VLVGIEHHDQIHIVDGITLSSTRQAAGRDRLTYLGQRAEGIAEDVAAVTRFMHGIRVGVHDNLMRVEGRIGSH